MRFTRSGKRWTESTNVWRADPISAPTKTETQTFWSDTTNKLLLAALIISSSLLIWASLEAPAGGDGSGQEAARQLGSK